jgi:DNA primase
MRCAEGRDYTRRQQKKVLYPVNTSVNYIFNSIGLDLNKPLIVVEGLMDVHKIWQWITANVTCTFGIQLKEHQKEQLSFFKDIILFIDDDEAGRRSIGLFEEFYPHDFRVAVSPGNDPGSSSREQLESAIDGAKLFNLFLMDDIGVFPERQRPSLI